MSRSSSRSRGKISRSIGRSGSRVSWSSSRGGVAGGASKWSEAAVVKGLSAVVKR